MRLRKLARFIGSIAAFAVSAAALATLLSMGQRKVHAAMPPPLPKLPALEALADEALQSSPAAAAEGAQPTQPVETVRVPKLTGRKLDKALRELGALGFRAHLYDEYGNDLDDDKRGKLQVKARRHFRVQHQITKAGSRVPRGSELQLWVEDTRGYVAGY
jgi:hypothetical protein